MNEDPASTAGAEIQHAHRGPNVRAADASPNVPIGGPGGARFRPGQELDDGLAAEADEREGAKKERLRGAP